MFNANKVVDTLYNLAIPNIDQPQVSASPRQDVMERKPTTEEVLLKNIKNPANAQQWRAQLKESKEIAFESKINTEASTQSATAIPEARIFQMIGTWGVRLEPGNVKKIAETFESMIKDVQGFQQFHDAIHHSDVAKFKLTHPQNMLPWLPESRSLLGTPNLDTGGQTKLVFDGNISARSGDRVNAFAKTIKLDGEKYHAVLLGWRHQPSYYYNQPQVKLDDKRTTWELALVPDSQHKEYCAKSPDRQML